MNNGGTPRLEIVFGPNGEMQMHHNLNAQQLSTAIIFLLGQALGMLKPQNPLVVPRPQAPPNLRGL